MAPSPAKAERCERCTMLPHAHWGQQAVLEEPLGLHQSPNLDDLWCPPEAGTVRTTPDPFDLAAAPGAEGESEVVVLPRTALLEFFGEVALPPWQDADGRWVGGDVDAAPLADRIVQWIKGHEL